MYQLRHYEHFQCVGNTEDVNADCKKTIRFHNWCKAWCPADRIATRNQPCDSSIDPSNSIQVSQQLRKQLEELLELLRKSRIVSEFVEAPAVCAIIITTNTFDNLEL